MVKKTNSKENMVKQETWQQIRVQIRSYNTVPSAGISRKRRNAFRHSIRLAYVEKFRMQRYFETCRTVPSQTITEGVDGKTWSKSHEIPKSSASPIRCRQLTEAVGGGEVSDTNIRIFRYLGDLKCPMSRYSSLWLWSLILALTTDQNHKHELWRIWTKFDEIWQIMWLLQFHAVHFLCLVPVFFSGLFLFGFCRDAAILSMIQFNLSYFSLLIFLFVLLAFCAFESLQRCIP